MTSWYTRFRRIYRSWQDAGPRPPQRLPTVLQLPVNDICNSHCQMCHIWQRKRDHELTPLELDRILSDSLYKNVAHVGINGGEPTLRGDLEALVAILIARLPELEGVSLITNAIRAPRVIAAVDAIGGLCQKSGKKLDVMVSLDGIGEVHDRVRGVSGNFESAVNVIDYILRSRQVTSQRIGCTIIAENAFGVEDVLEFARAKGIYARFRLGIPHPRLYTAGLHEPFEMDGEKRFHVAAFLDALVQNYEREPSRRAFYISLRNQLVHGKPRTAGCAWKNRGVTLSPRGELSFCAVASPMLGNALTQTSRDLYWGGGEILSSINENSCGTCRHDYEGAGNRQELMRIWAMRVDARLPAPIGAPLRRARKIVQGWREWPTVVLGPSSANNRKACRAKQHAILLCGWYGTETLGDRAILAGLCRILKDEYPNIAIDISSLNPYVTERTRTLMPEIEIRSVIAMEDAANAITSGGYTAVAVAGGPLMSSIKEVIALYNLLRVASASGVRVGLLGCGLGPIAPRGARRHAIVEMVRNADVCVLRDANSAAIAVRDFGRSGPTEISLDPAFFWKGLTRIDVLDLNRPLTVALALRDWTLDEYASDLVPEEALKLKAHLEHELVKLVATLKCEIQPVQILPICMHTLAQGGDDRAFYRRLCPELTTLVPWRRSSPAEDLNNLRSAHGVVAMRFHSSVFSLALGIPFLALDYTRGGKIAALMRESGNAERLVSPGLFDGEAAAERLLSDMTHKRRPNAIDLASPAAVYRRAIVKMLG